MSDRFDREFQDMLRERASGDTETLSAITDGIGQLPRRGPSIQVGWIALIAVAVVALAVTAPRLYHSGPRANPSPSDSFVPGGPEAFAGDPRLAMCYGATEDMEYVFEMAHARDYQRYLPRMGLSPELDVDDPALAVIYREDWQAPPVGGGPVASQTTPDPGARYICVVVASGDPTLYANVDIAGLTLAVDEPSPTPTPSASSTLGDPALFASDPRLATCWGPFENIQFIFEIPHARDVHQYIPSMGREPELHTDASVLMVIYHEGWVPPRIGGGYVASPQPYSPAAGTRAICAAITDAETIHYLGVEITGLRPAGDSNVGPSTTRAHDFLQCPGQPQPEERAWWIYLDKGSTPDAALAALVAYPRGEQSPIPADRFEVYRSSDVEVVYAISSSGRLVVVAVVRRLEDGWYVTDVAFCEPSN